MAQKLVYVDDMTDEEGARPLLFSIEGVSFEIDLCQDNVKAFYEAIAPFVGKARRTSKNARVPEELRAIMGPQTTVVTPQATDPDLGPHSREDVADCKAYLTRLGIKPPGARIPVDMWRAWRANDPTLLRADRLPRHHEAKDRKSAATG